MNVTLERAQLLMEQRRFREAEKEIRSVLSTDSGNTAALALLAVCKTEEKNFTEAEALIQLAITLSPSDHYLVYIHARILFEQDKLAEAESRIREAINLYPYVSNYFGLLSAIYIDRKEWSKALEYANKGLEVDPEDLYCMNLRSISLTKLDRKDESFDTIREALKQDPENSYTHANHGWSLLEKGEHKKALEHFRKALQFNPSNSYAQSGMVEALKARYFIYRMFLRYAFWIGNMKGGMQWGVILGFYFGSKALGYISESYPALKPLIVPLIVLYLLFALSTWLIRPLSNLFLRLNTYGRYALKREETITSNFVGFALGAGLLSLTAYAFDGAQVWLAAGLFALTMMIPLSAMLAPSKRNARIGLICYTAALMALGLVCVWMAATGNPGLKSFAGMYIFGIIGIQFLANFLVIR
jgi:tetratricopeptide (TPR) repeat protein